MEYQEPVWINVEGYLVSSDYIKDLDGVRVALPAREAQALADRYDATLPTPEIVKLIERHATIISFHGFSPKKGETRASRRIQELSSRDADLKINGRTGLFAGHKKDIVVGEFRVTHPDNVAIFGGLESGGGRIQNLNAVDHYIGYYDYSHGTRLVRGLKENLTIPREWLRY